MKVIFRPDALPEKLILPQALKSGVTYKRSQFVLPFEHNGKQYAFNMLTRECIEGDVPDTAKAGEGQDDLIRAMFLVPEGKDESAYYVSVSSMIRMYAKKKGISAYTILPTLACNARCVYCYEEGRPQVTMTPETVKQTIRYIRDTHEGQEVTLHWFGGEPLLCVDIIDEICEGLKEAGVPYKSAMISNGSLITDEVIEKMKGLWNLKRIQISMDGAEADYIARKRYYKDQDHYHTVMRTISKLSEAGIAVAVRCNVDNKNWEGIPQYMEDMKRYIANKEHVSVYFSPLMDVRADQDDLTFWKNTIAARDLIVNAGFRPLAYMGLRRKYRVNHCMADGGSVVIGPDGSLFPCEHCPAESRFGDVFHGVTDEKAKTEFCRTDRVREKCRTCTFLPECTSFAACPWTDAHCKEAHEMNILDSLKRLVEDNSGIENPDEEAI